ncbi:uncharacterized protein LOC129795336 isoform X2 [Lutzomyia longipalpis]|uniref:uncharacterized protein LOC129795336 isoform X2 n=1 Tax=Lutzomyia longipalpis TaxID=7200 RepID=UPI0024840BD1|nr:uncharacterized protein LOC129795336 isoform X2 [Lutzomyia longipalpis]
MDATVEKLPLIDIATVADAPPVAEAAAKELEKREKVTEDVTPDVAAAAAINPEQTQTGSAAGSPKGAEVEEVEASEPQQCTTSPENGAEASPAVPDDDVKAPPPQEEEEVQSKVQQDDDVRPNNGGTAEAAAAATSAGGESENGDVPKSSDEGAPNAKEEAEAEQEEEEEVKVPRQKEERPDVEMQQQKQNNGREVMMPKRKLVDVQPVKMMRIRSWKSSATILKKRSIKWLNKNKYQLGRERNAFERQKDAADVLKEGSMASFGYEMFTGSGGSDGGGVGKKVKGANGGEEGDDADEEEVDEDEEEDEEEEEEDFEVMENQAKRSRMDDEDDDVEIVVTKKRDGGTEKVFCDRKNGKKGGSSNDDVMTTKRGAISPSSHHQQQQQQQGDHPVAKGNEAPDKGKQKRDGKLPSNAAAAAATQTHLDDPTKKLCLELEMNFASHDKMLTDYIEGTANESVGGIQRHVEQLIVEIQTLSDMIRAKEMEWNNMLHLKKVKEEIVARLTRRRHVMEFASAKFGMTPLDYGAFGGESKGDDSITKLTQALLSRAGMADGTHKGNSTSAEARNSQHLKSNDGNSSSLLAAFGASAAGVGGDLGAHTRSSGSDGGLTAAQATAFANDLFNGHNTRLTQQMGRQGAIKDVKSIIADYRQRHPEVVPRRGRRMKPLTGGEMSSSKEGGGNSRPSSADSSHSNATNSNFATSSGHAATQSGGAPTGSLSFKDVLVQFAKLSQSDRQMISTATEGVGGTGGGGGSKAPPPYPEVTLYPVSSQSAAAANEQMMLNNANNSHSNSLLHGILTKSTSRPNAAGFTSFSPTLARLLTAPERITNPQTGGGGGGAQFQQQLNPALNLSKSHSEITITPVVSQTNLQQSLLQQQQQQQRFENCNSSSGGVQIRMKQENVFNIDDEADDSADRLVIDEGGGERNAMDTSGGKEQQISIVGQEFHENEVPECQGCKKREAQFVCAGCGNQWYCSRECQVSAWDEHSEVCTG